MHIPTSRPNTFFHASPDPCTRTIPKREPSCVPCPGAFLDLAVPGPCSERVRTSGEFLACNLAPGTNKRGLCSKADESIAPTNLFGGWGRHDRARLRRQTVTGPPPLPAVRSQSERRAAAQARRRQPLFKSWMGNLDVRTNNYAYN